MTSEGKFVGGSRKMAGGLPEMEMEVELQMEMMAVRRSGGGGGGGLMTEASR